MNANNYNLYEEKMLNISFDCKNLYESDAIVVLVNNTLTLDQDVTEIDNNFHGIISKTVQNLNRFEGKFGQVITLSAVSKDDIIKHIILIGIGDESTIKEYQLEEIGGKIYASSNASKAVSVSCKINRKIAEFTAMTIASSFASGALLASYKFDKYFTKQTQAEKFSTTDFNIIVADSKEVSNVFEEKRKLATAIFWARDLISEAPNILHPETYAEKIATELEQINVKVNVLGEDEMRELGMGALLGVGQGSSKESKLVVMEYNGGDAKQKPVCLVGKGVTFDSGGISIKPSNSMWEMKYDMSGSAAVAGTVKALALNGAKVNVVGVVGLVENMPGGSAQRPGDIVKTLSGQTVEVLDTDAEGRLVLCDCVAYVQKNFDPACIIDLATLTGAIVVSLAHTYAGMFTNDDDLAEKLIDSSSKVNEKLWRMPLHKDFDDALKSSIADVANISNVRGAGSSTAAHFIGRFINEGVKWAHLDIAGMAWDKNGKNPICPKGAVGFGVRLLDKFIRDNYESN